MCEMAEVLGDKETQQKYSGILLKGKEAFERLLWNGGCSSVGNHTGRGAGVGYPFTLFYLFIFFCIFQENTTTTTAAGATPPAASCRTSVRGSGSWGRVAWTRGSWR